MLYFGALSSESVFIFFPSRQVPKIILNESSKITENALIELRGFAKRPLIRYFTKTKIYVVFVKYLVVSFRSHSIRAFSVFLRDSLRIISLNLTCWEKSKNKFRLNAPMSFFERQKLVHYLLSSVINKENVTKI
jgi:hypothetical protein